MAPSTVTRSVIGYSSVEFKLSQQIVTKQQQSFNNKCIYDNGQIPNNKSFMDFSV